MTVDLDVSARQLAFIEADAFEVLFGGAAGGGKSYGQLIDALLYALKYPGSKQLILRRTYPDLERSLMDIYTLEGVMHASAGDYIITGISGEQYPCKPEIFAQTYEEV